MTEKQSDTRRLCQLEDVTDGQSHGFVIETETGKKSLFAVRSGADLFVYINACPHIGTPLDIEPHKFLNTDASLIICSTHGALFEIDTGFCISGPCGGSSLSPVKNHIKNGWVYIDLNHDIPPPRTPTLVLNKN